MSDENPSKKMLWAGYIMSAAPVFMLLMSAFFKLTKSEQAVEGFSKMGYPDAALMGLGIVELACTVLYIIPRTSVLGAILLTGYLGGATDVHVRGGESVLIPVLLGVLVWGGLFLRDQRIRDLIPFMRS